MNVEKNGKWERILFRLVPALLTVIIGMIVFFVNQYDKRMTANEIKTEKIQQQIDYLQNDLLKQYSEMNGRLIRMETKLDILTDSGKLRK